MATRDPELRRRIALEAARLISEHGLRDPHAARRKAAAALGVFSGSSLPGLRDIEETLREHQRLFHADEHRADSANCGERHARQCAISLLSSAPDRCGARGQRG